VGTLLLSRWSWTVHLVRGRPGGRFHVGSGGLPTDSSIWRSMACGVRGCYLAVLPHLVLTVPRTNDNNDYDNVYGAVIMTKVIARVHPVHLMNVD